MKNRRWVFSQMGVSCTHKDINSLIAEIREIEESGMNGDKFELIIKDMPEEEFNKLPEYQG
jgi:hypothetical protein